MRNVSRADSGMTLFEVLLSIMLLSVFMGGFLAATDLLTRMFVGSSDGSQITELALAKTITSQRLSSLAQELSALESVAPFVGPNNCIVSDSSWELPVTTGSSLSPARWGLKNKQLVRLDNSVSQVNGSIERVCLYNTNFTESEPDLRPGLYFLQAEPLQVGPFTQPLRLLLCRPLQFCSARN